MKIPIKTQQAHFPLQLHTYFHHSFLKLFHCVLWKTHWHPTREHSCSCKGFIEAMHLITKAWERRATYLGSAGPICREMISAHINRALRREVELALFYFYTAVVHRLSLLAIADWIPECNSKITGAQELERCYTELQKSHTSRQTVSELATEE